MKTRFDATTLKKSADALLSKAVDDGSIPGVCAITTTSEGPIYEASFGEATLGSHQAMNTDTVVLLASMTKPITGAAAMMLVEQGRLQLDAPARNWVPDVEKLVVLEGWDDNGDPITRAPKKDVTLRHFLTHTSGLSYEFWNEDIGRYQERTGVPSVLTQENASLFTPMLAEPGEKWEYGISMDWAGRMVEAVSGQTLGVFMKENILDPLGMNSTAFKLSEEMEARRASVHQRIDSGDIEATDFVKPQDPEFEEGGGALYSTCNDYSRFVRMILNKGILDGNRVFKPETVELMSRNAIGDLSVNRMVSVMPELTADCEFFPGQRKTWGLSFMINEEKAPTGRSAGSLSWAGLPNAYFWIDPAQDIASVYMTQILPFADQEFMNLYLGFEKSVYDSLI